MRNPRLGRHTPNELCYVPSANKMWNWTTKRRERKKEATTTRGEKEKKSEILYFSSSCLLATIGLSLRDVCFQFHNLSGAMLWTLNPFSLESPVVSHVSFLLLFLHTIVLFYFLLLFLSFAGDVSAPKLSSALHAKSSKSTTTA